MSFAQKLTTLMSIYRLSNVTLARGVGVDPSLVSRWKSGERIPVRTSSAYSDISAYLSKVTMLEHDQKLLCETLEAKCDGPDYTAQALLSWLTGLQIEKPFTNVSGQLAVDIIDKMSDMLSTPSEKDLHPINLWPHVQGGQPTEHETFRGSKGKRQATINFLHSVHSSNKPTDVYLMSWGDKTWMQEDESFKTTWLRSLRSLAQNGHHLHILIPKITDFEELSTMFDMAMYKLGRCTLYTCPEQPIAHPTLFVAKNCCAVLSYEGKNNETLLYKNVNDTTMFEGVFHLWLEKSTPLYYCCDSVMSYAQRLVQLEDNDGPYYSLRNSINSILLPENALYQLLSKQLSAHEVDIRLDMIAKRHEIFEQALMRDKWVEIYPSSIFDAMLINGSCRLSGIELFFEQDATISDEILAQFLANLIQRLKTHANLHIILMDDTNFQINMNLKPEIGAFFSTQNSKGNQAAAYIGEPELLKDITRWFSCLESKKDEMLDLLNTILEGLLS